MPNKKQKGNVSLLVLVTVIAALAATALIYFSSSKEGSNQQSFEPTGNPDSEAVAGVTSGRLVSANVSVCTGDIFNCSSQIEVPYSTNPFIVKYTFENSSERVVPLKVELPETYNYVFEPVFVSYNTTGHLVTVRTTTLIDGGFVWEGLLNCQGTTPGCQSLADRQSNLYFYFKPGPQLNEYSFNAKVTEGDGDTIPSFSWVTDSAKINILKTNVDYKVTFTGPKTVKLGKKFTVTATLTNMGTETIRGHYYLGTEAFKRFRVVSARTEGCGNDKAVWDIVSNSMVQGSVAPAPGQSCKLYTTYIAKRLGIVDLQSAYFSSSPEYYEINVEDDMPEIAIKVVR